VDKAFAVLRVIQQQDFTGNQLLPSYMFAARCRAKKAKFAVQHWEMGIDFPVL
jgi:hypothetical protein